MTSETHPHLVVLHLTDELLAQLRPFMAGLDSIAAPQSQRTGQEILMHGHLAPCANAGQATQQLTLRGESYDALVARVGSTLDYNVRWQPNEYAPEGFVERIHPLELINGTHAPADCPQCGALILANRTMVICPCGQVVPLI